MARTFLLALPLLVGARPLRAQAPTVELVGASDVALDRRLERLLRSDPLIISADTMIARGDTVRRSVLVLDATLIHEGVIVGDLVGVRAGMFVRPRAVVEGDVVNIAGGLYRSELARIRGTIIDLPQADYAVVREPGRLVIEAAPAPSPVILDGFMGFHPPTYDRVNGVTAVWGATYRLPRVGAITPSVHGQGGWQTQRGEPTYGGDAALRWSAYTLSGGYAKGWATNEAWIRSDIDNSLHYLWSGRDYRDYRAVERRWVALARELGDEAKSVHATFELRGAVEDAHSLAAGDPWHLFGDSTRANPSIQDGRITSVTPSLALEWHGSQTDFRGHIAYEAARDWLDGAFRFDRLEAGGTWAMHALANHTLEIDLYGQVPLGSRSLPRQRWSFVGGSGTLQTVPFARFYGDHVVFVETKYIIPLPERYALPVLGAPDLQLVHGAGMAWTRATRRDLRQEVGLRLQFLSLYFRYMVDPAPPRTTDLDIGLAWPFGGTYPWQQ